MRSVLLLVSAFALSGCIYVHNSDLQKTAEDAQTEFQAVTTGGASAKLLQSKADFDKTVQKALDAGDARHFDVQLQAVPDYTWGDIFEQTNEELENASRDQKTLQGEVTNAKQALTAAMAKLDPAAKVVATAVAAVNDAANAEARYAATQSVLRDGMKALFKEEPSTDDFNKALAEKIPVRSFTAGDDETLKETSSDKTVGDILGLKPITLPNGKPSLDDLTKLFGQAKDLPKLSALKGLDFESPGLATTIMSLGYDVARAEELRIRAEIDGEKSRYNLLQQKFDIRTKQVAALKADAFVSTQPAILKTYAKGNRDALIGDSLEAYSGSQRDKVKLRKDLATILDALSTNYENRVVVPIAIERLNDQLALAEADRALATANVNLMERQALISRGLDGLVAFHRGGISSDDVANLMRLAQAVGIFSIAGGWL